MVSNKFLRNFLRKHNTLPYNILMYIGVNQNGDLLYQRQIAKYFKKRESTINYHITKFKEEGLISYHLELSNKGKKLFQFLWKNAGIKKLRAHNIQIKFNLTKCPANYTKRYSKCIYQSISNGKFKGFKGKLDNITFMFYSRKTISCVISGVLANSSDEISATIQLIVTELKDLLEQTFEGIKIEGYELARIQTSHIAILDSIIANKSNEKGYTSEGKKIAIDKSNGENELEATDPETNLEDIDSLLKLEEWLKKKNSFHG